MASTFHRYVALGDSFTEGVGDHDPTCPNGVRGWADRVAEVLAAHDRRLRLRQPRDPRPQDGRDPRRAGRARARAAPGPGHGLRRRQRHPAAAGQHRRPRRARTTTAVGRLAATGAHVVLFTGFDLGFAPVFRHLRGRVATYNELVREVADDTRRDGRGLLAAAGVPRPPAVGRGPAAHVVGRPPADGDRRAGHPRRRRTTWASTRCPSCRRWTAASAATPTWPGRGRTPRPWVQRRLPGRRPATASRRAGPPSPTVGQGA